MRLPTEKPHGRCPAKDKQSKAAPSLAPVPAKNRNAWASCTVDDKGEPFLVPAERRVRQHSGDKESVDVYPVIGTEGVWGVYPSDDRKGRWVGLHMPTGLAAYVNFASRIEAEDVLSWTWLNAIDQDGVRSSDSAVVCTAFGARVRSRFFKGGPVRHPRRKRPGSPGDHPTLESTAEAAYTALARKNIKDCESWRTDLVAERQLLVEEGKLTKLREETVTALEIKVNQKGLDLHEKQAELYEETKQARIDTAIRQEENERDRIALVHQAMELNKLRTAMYHALETVDVNAVLGDDDDDRRLGRYLRKIRIKGVYNPSLDQEAPDGSS